MKAVNSKHYFIILLNRLSRLTQFTLKVALVSGVLTASFLLLWIVVFCVLTTLLHLPPLQAFISNSLTQPFFFGWLYGVVFLGVLAFALFSLFFISTNKKGDNNNGQ